MSTLTQHSTFDGIGGVHITTLIANLFCHCDVIEFSILSSCYYYLQDELEALKSIYEGDECFNIVDNTTLQYKVKKMSSHAQNVVIHPYLKRPTSGQFSIM